MALPRLGVELELQLDPSLVCDLHPSSQQFQILNPLNETRDRTCNPMVPSLVCFHCAMMGTPGNFFFFFFCLFAISWQNRNSLGNFFKTKNIHI